MRYQKLSPGATTAYLCQLYVGEIYTILTGVFILVPGLFPWG